jgi:hydrogenase expression/formation protein HypC
MCLGIPGEIVDIDAEGTDLATVDVVGVHRKINIGLLEPGVVHVGDWVLVHVGFAMSRIDESEAAATLAMLTGLGQAYTDELQALTGSDIS